MRTCFRMTLYAISFIGLCFVDLSEARAHLRKKRRSLRGGLWSILQALQIRRSVCFWMNGAIVSRL